jgi:hypothetical protein
MITSLQLKFDFLINMYEQNLFLIIFVKKKVKFSLKYVAIKEFFANFFLYSL